MLLSSLNIMIKTSKTRIKNIIFIASFPPRRCGIATFTQDLFNSMQTLMPDVKFSVIAMQESKRYRRYPKEVIQTIDQKNVKSYDAAARYVNKDARSTIVVIQHEYGIHGGEWGENVLSLYGALRCPVVTTFHTVLADPPERMREVTETIMKLSDAVVVLTDTSAKILKQVYPDDAHKVSTIQHGIHPVVYSHPSESKSQFRISNRKVLLTFGLLGRAKGIENVIKALPALSKNIPDVMYLVVGATHPGVLKLEGESYRRELKRLAKELGVEKFIRFVPRYMPLKKILEYIKACDVYIATPLNPQQSVSGTLSYALGTGRPVISTNFSQAREIVTPDVGRLVEIGDVSAIADATVELFGDLQTLDNMGENAYKKTRSMLWSNVAYEYVKLLGSVSRSSEITLAPDLKWRHLEKMTDKFGLFQFSTGTKPSRRSGYTLDDNARALQVIHKALGMDLISPESYKNLSEKYLGVIGNCLEQDPTVNYIATDKKPTTQNNIEDLRDSLARAYYALETVQNYGEPVPEVGELIRKIPDTIFSDEPFKTSSQALLGVCMAYKNGDKSAYTKVKSIADKLVDHYKLNSEPDWKWFEKTITYASGQACAGLIEAARVTGSKVYAKIGLESLDFLSSVCFMGGVYVPIGQDGWFTQGGKRALFDQQPEDVFSMIHALQEAHLLTNDKKYLPLIRKVFSWFLGNNLLGLRMYDDKTGGCHDGLEPGKVNMNMGAESTLSYLHSRLILSDLT
jgi:glycosyltransferase involved in cell wall biosynthesis